MKKEVPMGPAYEVRKVQRRNLLYVVKEKVIEWEGRLGALNLHRILMLLIIKQIVHGRGSISASDLLEIPWETRERAERFFNKELRENIKKFQNTEKEGNALFAMLYKWLAGRIADQHLVALDQEQDDHPKRVYGGKNANDLVPFT